MGRNNPRKVGQQKRRAHQHKGRGRAYKPTPTKSAWFDAWAKGTAAVEAIKQDQDEAIRQDEEGP